MRQSLLCVHQAQFPYRPGQDYISQPSSTPLHLDKDVWLVLYMESKQKWYTRASVGLPLVSFPICLLQAKDFKDHRRWQSHQTEGAQVSWGVTRKATPLNTSHGLIWEWARKTFMMLHHCYSEFIYYRSSHYLTNTNANDPISPLGALEDI